MQKFEFDSLRSAIRAAQRALPFSEGSYAADKAQLDALIAKLPTPRSSEHVSLDRPARTPLFGRYLSALIRIKRASAALACALREGRHVEANRHRLSVWAAYEYARTGKQPRDPSIVEYPDPVAGAAQLHAQIEARRAARSIGFARVDSLAEAA